MTPQTYRIPLARIFALAALLTSLSRPIHASELSQAQILLPPSATAVERQAAAMITEEVERRTGLSWPISTTSSGGPASRIVLVDRSRAAEMLNALQIRDVSLPAALKAEGFAVRVLDHGRTVLVIGADDRGVLFGAGFLLRHLDMTAHAVATHELVDIESAPAYTVRGHQLGYRPKNNTFDAWTAAQFEQYIRDLAIFGTNTIEIIPPRSDDDAISPLYTLQPMPMMVELSKIINRYGLDCSIWYPALDKDYSNPATVDAAVAEWGAVFDQLERVDAVFVPGGDPGHTEPKYLLALLEKEAARLRQKHPHAQMWVSPQSFSKQWMDEFYALVDQKPKWLTGVVYGPEMRDSFEEFRRKIPAQIPIRFYPDITHVLSAQYPVPNFDPAFALTEGREPVNPRPQDQSILFHRYAPLSNGFVAYSEGSNDDVNKVLWSGWSWDPKQPASTILAEYARTFLSVTQSDSLAKSIEGLEANWRGPVQSNTSISAILSALQAVEQQQPALAKTNWRFEQLLYRGYYDAYVQKRARREHESEQTALSLLQSKPLTDAHLDSALEALSTPADCSKDILCQHLESLANDLFHNIGMQLSVPKYHALAVGRGANLDRVDAPLSDAPWLTAQISKARKEKDLSQRNEIIENSLKILGAAEAGSYDILGDTFRAPHLVRGKSFSEDPSSLEGTYLGAGEGRKGASVAPLVWHTFAGTLYDRPLELLYHDLAPHQPYVVQVRFISDARRFSLLLNGVELSPTCEDSDCLAASYHAGASLIPAKQDVRLSIRGPQGAGGNGRIVSISTVRITPAKE